MSCITSSYPSRYSENITIARDIYTGYGNITSLFIIRDNQAVEVVAGGVGVFSF